MRSRIVPAQVAVLAALLVLLAGCSGAGGATTSEPTVRDSIAAAPSSPPEPDPSTVTPSVTPATGDTIVRDSVTFVLPTSFVADGEVDNGLLGSATWASEPLRSIVSLGELADLSSFGLEEAAKLAADNRTPPVQRRADREVGGRRVYVLAGSDGLDGTSYEVGRVAGDQIVSLSFTFQKDDPGNQDLVESILATVRWKG